MKKGDGNPMTMVVGESMKSMDQKSVVMAEAVAMMKMEGEE